MKFGIPGWKGFQKTGVVGFWKVKGRENSWYSCGYGCTIHGWSELHPLCSTIKGRCMHVAYDCHVTIFWGWRGSFNDKEEIRETLSGYSSPQRRGVGVDEFWWRRGFWRTQRLMQSSALTFFLTFPLESRNLWKRRLASVDNFTTKLIGKGAHAAYPHVSKIQFWQQLIYHTNSLHCEPKC